MSTASPARRHPWLAGADLVGLLVVLGFWQGALPARYLPFDLPLGALAATYVVSIAALLRGGLRAARVASWAALLRMLGGLGFLVLLAMTAADVSGRFGPIGPVGAGFMYFGMALFVPYLLVFPALQVAYLGAQCDVSTGAGNTLGRRLRRLLFASLGVVVASFVTGRALAVGSVAEAPSDAVMRTAFAATRGEGEAPEHHAAGPITMELVRHGRVRGQYVGTSSLRETVLGALAHFSSPLPTDGAWVISVPTRRSRPAPWPWLDLLQLAPLHDGVLLRSGAEVAVETPTSLQLRGAHLAVPFAPMPVFQFGTDLGGIVTRLREELGLGSAAAADVEILRYATFTDPPYLDATRRRALPRASEAVVRQAVVDNVDFILRNQRGDGLFAYQVDAARGLASNMGYDFTRHAGVAYFLAQAGHQLGLARATEGARLGVRFLEGRVRACGPNGARCVVTWNGAEFGATSLLAVALYDLRSVADTAELAALHHDVLTFLKHQQRDDGEMMHGFDLDSGTPVDVQHLYFSGEAALALVRGAAIERDAQLERAARRLLQYLAVSARDSLAEPYLMGEEHWTCIAHGEQRALLGEDPSGVRGFCERWAAFSRRVQFQPGETVWDVTGAYGLGPIIPPQITGTASRTEAFAAMLAGADGGHDPALVRQVERGVQALLQHQFRPGPTHLMRRPEAMRGGITGAPGDLVVRNDYVQHAGSAYLRYLAALAERR
ncbi:MAG: hypothetical protein IPN77_22835 [Sandaracinaceae bacterium]|nr:hypothetical protein [Sandaracinaceae bacterium]